MQKVKKGVIPLTPDPALVEDGLRLLKARKAVRGMTQTALGKRVHVVRQTVGAWERGTWPVGPLEREAVARELGVRVGDIWHEKGQKEGHVPHETSEAFIAADAPLAAHVLVGMVKIGELSLQTHSLAGQIITAMGRHRGIADELQRRAEVEVDDPPAGRSHVSKRNDDHLGLRIAVVRSLRDKTVAQLAGLVDISESQLQKIEDGRVRQIDDELRKRFAQALKTTPQKLFGDAAT